jgi:hypothetical protein
MTAKGTKCKSPAESCRFHCTTAKKKSRTTPTSTSPKKRGEVSKSSSLKASLSPPRIEKGSDIDLLNNLPPLVLYQTLLKIPREELNEICESASKLRRRGILTNIEKICREERFQKEYRKIHPPKEYPILFDSNIDLYFQHMSSGSWGRGHPINVIVNEKGIIRFIYSDVELQIWKKGTIWFTRYESSKDSEEIKTIITRVTGRPNLFSKHAKERGKAVESLLRQIISEAKEQYRQGRIDDFMI